MNKQTYWRFLNEIMLWKLSLLNSLPGHIGIWARKKYYLKNLQNCGENFRIHQNSQIINPQYCSIGNNVEINQDVWIDAYGDVSIGSNVGIGPGTKIWANNHSIDSVEIPIFHQKLEKKPVVIEDDVWIAANCFVKPGITIGMGSVISAGSIIFKNVPPYSISAGNPARVVGWRKENLSHTLDIH